MKKHVIAAVSLVMMLAAGSLFAQAEAEQFPVVPDVSVPAETVEPEGVLVARVLPDSAAQRAGIQRGDIILMVAQHPVTSVYEITDVLSGLEHGDMVEITLKREAEELTIDLQLETRISWPLLGITGIGSQYQESRDWGMMHSPRGGYRQFQDQGDRFEYMQPFMGYDQIPEEVIDSMESGDAARIVEVVPGSPAEQADLRAGAVILSIDGQRLTDGALAEVIASYEPGSEIQIRAFDGQGITDYTVILRSSDEQSYLGVRYIPVGAGMQRMFEPSFDRGSRYRSPWNIDG
jgi:C-terminal processing protease CtpA/Prc